MINIVSVIEIIGLLGVSLVDPGFPKSQVRSLELALLLV